MAGITQADGSQGITRTPPVAPAAPAKAPSSPAPTEPQSQLKDSSFQQSAVVPRGSIPASGLAADNQQHLRVPTRLLDSAFGTIKVHQSAEEGQDTHPTLFQRLFGWVRRRR